MGIGIITCLGDAQIEDSVISSLFSGELPELNLEHRALSFGSLHAFLVALPRDDQRRILIHDLDEVTLSAIRAISAGLVQLRLTEATPNGIRSEVSRSLRNFDSVIPQQRQQLRTDLVLVTGTSGAPGITTVALNLASELAFEREIQLVDLDSRRKDLAFLLGGKRAASTTRLDKKLSISSGELSEGALNLADGGVAPDLSLALSDRRSAARSFSDTLDCAATVIFVAQPENNLTFELERFLDAYSNHLFSARPLFLINKLGSSVRHRSILRRCQARIGSLEMHTAPWDQSALERSKTQYAPLAAVAPRSRLRKSLRDLALQLLQ